jgi:hypothetical protein
MVNSDAVINSDTALGGSQIDILLERYVWWREDSLTVQLAYERWSQCEHAERGLAYAGYLAALDREEQAARVYAGEIESARRGYT